MLAKPGLPIVRISLDDAQAARVAVAQTASIQLGTGTSGATAQGSVESITPASVDGSVGPFALLDVKWADGQARLGAPVQVTVNLGSKQDVLVVIYNAANDWATAGDPLCLDELHIE